jgi:hypothetical protein
MHLEWNLGSNEPSRTFTLVCLANGGLGGNRYASFKCQ